MDINYPCRTLVLKTGHLGQVNKKLGYREGCSRIDQAMSQAISESFKYISVNKFYPPKKDLYRLDSFMQENILSRKKNRRS